MIKFSLKCDHGHQFESWFQSNEAYEKLQGSGLVACATCGSTKVEKMIMAPSVRASRSKAEPAPDATPALNAPADPMQDAIAAMKKHVEENSEYVGMGFAAQARDMHDGLAPVRTIHGEAKPDEARKLIEDGVPVAPLPFVPTRKTN